MSTKAWVVVAALLATGMAQATCYSIYKADGTLVHQTSSPPVNLSLPHGDSVPEKYGVGASMTVSDLGVYCKDQRGANLAASASAGEARRDEEQAESVAVKQLSGPTAGPLGGAAPR